MGRMMKRLRGAVSGETVLLLSTIVAVILAIAIGAGLQTTDPKLTPREIAYIHFPGEMFLRMLKLLILPLITSSLISSLTGLDTRTAGRMGLLATSYYITTTLLAVILGIILVLAIRPGDYGRDGHNFKDAKAGGCPGTTPGDTIMDLLRNMFPTNLVEACFASQSTCLKQYKLVFNTSGVDYPGETMTVDEFERRKKENTPEGAEILRGYSGEPKLVDKSGMNILGLVVFSLIFGAVINRMGDDGLPLARFFKALEGAMMTMVSMVIWISPIGIFFLILGRILMMDDLMGELGRLGMYMVTVIVGLAVHGFITIPVLFLILARRNPLKFVYGMLQALLTALGTASSSATMPLTLQCLKENNGINPRVAHFMIPLGATINMDGTALYEAVAALYIAQTLGKVLSIGQVILISLTATLASIGAAGIPQAGLVTMIMVLTAVDLPPEMFALIVPVDWFLDRLRTTINVHGDAMGTAVVQRFCQAQLDEMDRHDREAEAPPSYHSDDDPKETVQSGLEIDVKRNTARVYPSDTQQSRM